jgi:hypothetical protein
VTTSTDLVNWQAILERLADDVRRLEAAHDDPLQLAAILLAGVGRTPPPAGTGLPPALRAQADQLLARMNDLERTLTASARRLAREVRDTPDTPAFYLDTKA